MAGEDVAKKVYTLNMSITYDTKKPGEFVEKGFQYGFPNVVLYVWTKKGKNGQVFFVFCFSPNEVLYLWTKKGKNGQVKGLGLRV